jgi:hypothetical protein
MVGKSKNPVNLDIIALRYYSIHLVFSTYLSMDARVLFNTGLHVSYIKYHKLSRPEAYELKQLLIFL